MPDAELDIKERYGGVTKTMAVIHTYLSKTDCQRLSAKDNSYLKRQLEVHSALNKLLGKPIDKPLLAELLCLLDKKPIARRKPEQRNSKVSVYKDGRLIRIECSNGKALKVIA